MEIWFKSIKSIVRIELTSKQPPTTWNLAASNEYGFYANVNPTVQHPRWSQASERRLPSSLFNGNRKIPTRMYNGYEEVASFTRDELAPQLLKSIVFAVCSIPLLVLGWDVANEIRLPGSTFGPPPAEAVVDLLGIWTIRFLLITLSISTFARIFKRPEIVSFRRTVGLWTFAYACLHFLGYFTLLAEYSFSVGWKISQKDLYHSRDGSSGIVNPACYYVDTKLAALLGRRWRSLHALIIRQRWQRCYNLWAAKASLLDVSMYGFTFAYCLRNGLWLEFADAKIRV
ncbi:MAG: hypothetical protein CM1200mP9_01380 [Gammaproteobacteria bacterium]|nr:MAG: hypothetical protein CM1200mP9_01380 [Gammaproteobacteria bacterium]